MKREQLTIPKPCHESWEQMHGDEQKRFCDHCTKHVHNLSMMTKADAAQLLEARGDSRICVQYTYDETGEVMFRDNETPSWKLFSQKEGLKLLLSAAALAVPMLLGACDTAVPLQGPEATATSPIKLEEGRPATLNVEQPTEAQPGAGRQPTFSTTPAPTPDPVEPPDHMMVEQGEIAPLDEQEQAPKPSCDGESEGADKGTSTAVQETPKVEPKPVQEKTDYRHVKGRMPLKNRHQVIRGDLAE